MGSRNGQTRLRRAAAKICPNLPQFTSDGTRFTSTLCTPNSSRSMNATRPTRRPHVRPRMRRPDWPCAPCARILRRRRRGGSHGGRCQRPPRARRQRPPWRPRWKLSRTVARPTQLADQPSIDTHDIDHLGLLVEDVEVARAIQGHASDPPELLPFHSLHPTLRLAIDLNPFASDSSPPGTVVASVTCRHQHRGPSCHSYVNCG